MFKASKNSLQLENSKKAYPFERPVCWFVINLELIIEENFEQK